MSPPRRRSKDRYKRRSRSRSRERERDREREREKDRDRDRDRDRRRHDARSRSRSRDRTRRHRSRSPRFRSRSPRNRSFESRRSRERSKDRKHGKQSGSYVPPPHKLLDTNLGDLSNEEKEMMKMMGFCNFDTTKGKKVEGNDVGEVHVILKRKYRQYMNRKGGFNRPLDFVA